MLPVLTEQLRARSELNETAVADAARALASAEVPEAEKEAFLLALDDKGETPAELAAFARAFRAVAVDPGVQAWSPRAIDIVGTGGDHAGGFNISSLVVLTLASAGVPVMKHGNRGITSKCGSADLLAALGFDLAAPPERLRAALAELGYVFFFAPNYHPAFRHIAPVRKALAARGRRSVFNILGPLINPGRPAHILLGVFSPTLLARLAPALTQLGTESGIAAHGILGEGRGIDELTTATDNVVRGIGRLSSLDAVWRPEDFGITRRPFDDLLGGDLPANRSIVEAVLAGNGPQGLVDTIVLNTALGLWLVGRVTDPREGLGLARELLLGGPVARKIADTRAFFAA